MSSIIIKDGWDSIETTKVPENFSLFSQPIFSTPEFTNAVELSAAQASLNEKKTETKEDEIVSALSPSEIAESKLIGSLHQLEFILMKTLNNNNFENDMPFYYAVLELSKRVAVKNNKYRTGYLVSSMNIE